MDVKKSLKTAFTFVATMVGAGFISGQEIALYFAETSLLVPLLGGIASGFLCFVFTTAGRITGGKMLGMTFGKGAFAASVVIRLCNLVTFCAMIAGSEHVVFSLLGISGGGIISAFLSLVFVCFGVERLKLLNTLSMPLIIVLLFWILVKTAPEMPIYPKIKLLSPLLYAGMNMISAGVLTADVSSKLTKKECALSSAIAAATLTLLICVIYLIIQKYFDKTMPLLYTADTLGMSRVASAVTYLAIFTTLVGSHYVASANNKITAAICTAVGLIVSVVGFKKLVDTFYPVMGYLGVALSVCVSGRLVYLKIKKRSVDNLDVLGSDKIHHLRRHGVQISRGKR